MWSRAGPVVVVPRRTTRRNSRSRATSQVTSTRGPFPEPGRAVAVGVTRVQSTTAVGSGSPEATPWRKTRAVAAWSFLDGLTRQS